MTSDLLTGLNEQQYAAVTAGAGPVLVLAGPGSGKTGVLTRRVAYLIEEMGVYPNQIMAVTFTNKAAAEMKNRIYGFVGEGARGLHVSTFHSMCARFLRIESAFLDYNEDYVIYDSDDQQRAVAQVMGELDIPVKKFAPRAVLSAISAAKNELILPDQFVGQDYFSEIVARVYPRYQAMLRDSNAMDFDDLLLNMVLLLKREAIVREKYQQRLPFVLVDEFQDTNTAQYQLVQLLGKPQNNLFVVGDEDQSIYAFRGADYRNVLRFKQDYPDAKVILLEQNYRSTQIVLDVARAIIDHNSNRTPKQLFTTREGGSKVTLRETYDDQSEARWVVETMQALMRDEDYSYGDFAIMYRTNAQSRALEAACRDHGMPYRLVGGVGFYQRREVRDLMAYLRVVANPDDKMSFARIVNAPKRGIGKKSLASFINWTAQANLSYSAALQMLIDGEKTPLSGRAQKALTGFAQQIFAWRELLPSSKLASLYDTISGGIGYHLYVHDISDTPEQAIEREENLRELRGLLAIYDEAELSLGEFLQEQQLMTDEDRSDEDNDDKITLLTLHAAKGLEFPVVFITGLEEGLLPHQRAFEELDGVQEERRLFYVGITRAEDHLYLSYSFRRALFGGFGDVSTPSSFLRDLPPQHLSTNARIAPDTDQVEYRSTTTWDNTGDSRLSRDLYRERQQPSGHVSDENIRSKIIPFPGGKAGADPLQFKTGMRVRHKVFGDGTVIESKRVAGSERVTVAFEDKRFGIKELDAEFANLDVL